MKQIKSARFSGATPIFLAHQFFEPKIGGITFGTTLVPQANMGLHHFVGSLRRIVEDSRYRDIIVEPTLAQRQLDVDRILVYAKISTVQPMSAGADI